MTAKAKLFVAYYLKRNDSEDDEHSSKFYALKILADARNV